MNSVNQLRSAVQYIDRPLDCRRLCLSIKFHLLDEKQTLQMCNTLMHYFPDMLDGIALFDWLYKGKRISTKGIWNCLEKPFTPHAGISVGFSGYIASPLIANLTMLREHERNIKLLNPRYVYGWDTGELESIDYPPYLNSYFPSSVLSNEEKIEGIYRIFCEPNRQYQSFHHFSDFGGGFYASEYNRQENLYYGTAAIWISSFCAGCEINKIAEELAKFAQELSEKFININAHVSLQPHSVHENPYMQYFGKYGIIDGSHEDNGCMVREWYPYYFLCGVEWLNILSPLTRKLLLSDYPSNVDVDEISIRNMRSGALLVQSKRDISSYNRDAALNIKHKIMDALYPGRSSVPIKGIFPKPGQERVYSWCPRNDWSIVPVEKNEITIIGTDLVFISKNYMTYE